MKDYTLVLSELLASGKKGAVHEARKMLEEIDENIKKLQQHREAVKAMLATRLG